MFAVAAFLASALPDLAEADNKRIYTDFLNTGWTELYSSAAVSLTATTRVHSGGRSISVLADAGEALYLYTPNISTVGYTGLTFWVNGGIAGGQALKVCAVRGGVVQAPAQLQALPTNAWRAVSLPLSLLGVASAPDFNGFIVLAEQAVPVFFIDDIYLIAGIEVDPVPSIARPLTATAGAFTFLLTGRAGETYITEMSTDLRSWQPVATNVLAGTTLPVTVTTTNGSGFFRVIWRQ